MARFRYEAIDSKGVPIHGDAVAVDEAALIAQLEQRKLELVSCSELSLEALIRANSVLLPRLYEMRVGEQLREALMTGMPAHIAVRAVAAEPVSHPLLGVIPWLQGMAIVILLAASWLWQVFGLFGNVVVGMVLIAGIVVPSLRMLLVWLYRTRPRQILNALADRLEKGEGVPATLQGAMPEELRPVMKSAVSDDCKARVAGDVLPGLLGNNLRKQQFVMTLLGPLVLMAVVLFGIHSVLLFVIPDFKQIFDDFGTELPFFTQIVVSLSDRVAVLGTTGWIISALSAGLMLILITVGLSSGWAAELMENVPVFGVAFRWAMQARVARILASMIRNDCEYGESLRAATQASGFARVREHGVLLAKELESEKGSVMPMRQLSGLPISMLFSSDTSVRDNDRKAAVSDTFQNLSEMLEAATVGQGRLLAVILQFLVVIFTGFAVGVGVLAMFLPMIKLLNDLS